MNIRLAIFLAAPVVAALVIGCGRTPPASERSGSRPKARTTAQRLAQSETDQAPPAEGGRAVLRDAAVQRATYQTPAAAPKNEQQLAADALSRIGPPAVPMLVEALQSPDQHVRRQACEVLMRMGPDAKEAVPELVRLLDDQDAVLRRSAAIALGRIGPDAADAVPALMRTMLEGEPLPPPANDH